MYKTYILYKYAHITLLHFQRNAIRTRSKANRESKEVETSLVNPTHLLQPGVNDNTSMTRNSTQAFNASLNNASGQLSNENDISNMLMR